MRFFRNSRVARRIGLLACLAVGVFNTSEAAACASNQATADGPADWTFEVAIKDGKVAEDQRTIRVTEDDTVHLHFTTDAPVVLHVHGYDVENAVAPGPMTAITFKTDVTGRFAVEIHGPTGSHGSAEGHPPLMFLEVYPR